MGRPPDQFAWDQVEKLENGTWKCKHCTKVHSGAGSRIRNHLSGQGNGIAACEKASEAIKNKASKKVIQKKGVGGNSSAVSTSMTRASKRATEEETVIDTFVKFLMCNNSVPSFHSDYVVKDPSLRELMESVGQHGVLSLLRGDSLALQHSVLRIKHEVESNMLMLKESWETTGCTLMAFDLTKHFKKEEFDRCKGCYMKDNIVIAIYCPKGIIFMEAPADDDYDYEEALRLHSPSLYSYELIHFQRHGSYDHDSYKICELNHNHDWDGVDLICLRSEIQNLCSRSLLDSEWAQSLVDVAVRIHEHLCILGDPWYYNVLTENHISLDVSLFKKKASCIPIFLLIIQHAPEMESPKHDRLREDDIEEITRGHKFWSDGRQLALILDCVLKLADVMDTLVPTAGYFAMAVDKVKDTIQFYGPRLGEDALRFWRELKSCIEHDTYSRSRVAASYLNPVYFLEQLQKEKDPLLPADNLKKALKGLYVIKEDQIDEEVESYGKVFSKMSKRLHPVKLWEEHGSDLPLLKGFALKLLSRPLSCVCKQVKEHLYQLEYAEDYILRMNFRMMRHFQQLGDDIYRPISFYELERRHFTKYIVDNEPRSVQNCNSSSSGDSDDHGGSPSGDLDDHGGLKNAQSRVRTGDT